MAIIGCTILKIVHCDYCTEQRSPSRLFPRYCIGIFSIITEHIKHVAMPLETAIASDMIPL